MDRIDGKVEAASRQFVTFLGGLNIALIAAVVAAVLAFILKV